MIYDLDPDLNPKINFHKIKNFIKIDFLIHSYIKY